MLKVDFGKWVFLISFSMASTLLSIGLLYIINIFLTNDIFSLPGYYIPVFFSFIIYSYMINRIFQAKFIVYSYSLVYENEIRILDKIHRTSLANFEKYGAQRFYSVLEDLRTFMIFPSIINTVVNSLVTVIICLGYLLWISPGVTAILMVFIFLMIIVYLMINKVYSKRYDFLRSLNDEYYKFVDDSIKGFKELKVSHSKRENFFNNFLSRNREMAKTADIKLATRYQAINLISQYGIYVLIGIVFYLLSFLKILNQKETITYVVALLFLNGPINYLISLQNFFIRIKISKKRIDQFFKDFEVDESSGSKEIGAKAEYNYLTFRDVSFKYQLKDADAFVLKGMNLTIERGETLFIIGGNGSGKTTFINILTGLYRPSSGEILLNKVSVDNSGNAYKDNFSAIFTDNHLFSKNYEDYKISGNPRYKEWIKLMKMDNSLLTDDESELRRSFSKGQSKRIALILALLEDRPILVLDEWAADQDPHFRKYFYEKLIPRLKREGKTIIAVTHDDHYFKYADRIIKFEYGEVVKEVIVQENSLEDII